MIFINLILYFVGRYAFRIVLILFGWAEKIFIGENDFKENIRFYSFTGLSILWVYVLISGIFSVRDIFAEIPVKSVSVFLRTALMTGGSFILPFSGGIILGGRKDTLKEYIKDGVSGFIYCSLMVIAFISMLLFGTIITAKRFIKKEIALFVGFSVKDKRIVSEEEIINELRGKLGDISVKKPSLIYSIPGKILGKIKMEGEAFQKRALYLEGKDFKIFINNDDLMIEACKSKCHAVKIKIAEIFMYSKRVSLMISRSAKFYEESADLFFSLWKEGRLDFLECFKALERIKAYTEGRITFYEWSMLSIKILSYERKILMERRRS